MKALKIKTIQQIGAGVAFRITSVASILISTPYILKDIGIKSYGEWSIYLSILTWALMLDFGVANQLRNISRKIIDEAHDVEKINNLLFCCILISGGCILLASFLFNSTSNIDKNIFSATLLSVSIVVLTNCFKSIIYSIDRSDFVFFIAAIPNMALLSFSILKEPGAEVVHYISAYIAGLSISLVLAVLFLTLKGIFPDPRTNIIYVIKKFNLINGGLSFLTLQLISLTLLSSDRLLILYLFGQEEAGKYDILFRVYNASLMLFSIINTVLWTKFSNQWNNNKKSDIKKSFSRIDKAILFTFIPAALYGFFANESIAIWLGHEIEFSSNYIVGCTLYTIGFFAISSYSSFMNGAGLITIQSKIQLIAIILKALVLYVFFINHSESTTPDLVVTVSGVVMLLIAYLFRRNSHIAIHKAD